MLLDNVNWTLGVINSTLIMTWLSLSSDHLPPPKILSTITLSLAVCISISIAPDVISQVEVHINMDGKKPLNDVEMVLLNTEKLIKSKMPNMDVVLVIPHALKGS
jgi:hypothetical protein